MSYTLRDLPLPVKVVASVFLLAVGAGYTSAMLQLHIQDSKSGKPMPTFDDVVLKFTGKKRVDPNAPPPRPVSRLEALITSETVVINGASMTAAFTTEDRSKGDLKHPNAVKSRGVETVKAERKGEQAVFALWISAPEEQRKAAYTADKFVPPAGKMPAAFTPGLKDGDAVKIKTLIDARCVTCHSKGGDKEDVLLDNYEGLKPFMTVTEAQAVNGWIKVEEPISISKLTQSTHAHLLSFAMLFSLTGVIFAFSSWPAWMRVIIGPSVVIAVFADVSLWWLARLCDEWGPYFAMGVIGTGFIAGCGLCAQISLSLFNMYGWKGKGVIALLFVVGALAGGAFVMKLLAPALPKPKIEEKKQEDKKSENPPPLVNGGKGASDGVVAASSAITEAVSKKQASTAPRKPMHALDKLLIWPPIDLDGNAVPLPADPKQFPFNGEGTMVHAFFEKDKAFKKVVDGSAPQIEKDQLRAQRKGDLDVMLAWVRSPDSVRKAAYQADKFDFPGLSDKLVSPELLKDKKVRIKSLIDARCVTCHGPEGKQSDYLLDSYEELSKYLKPFDAPKGEGNTGAAPQPAAVPVKITEPIPDAKDD
ncbi:Putative uncharacterized protein OS=Novosphingobium sp. PP1Y GN=PP1Y_AT23285 PE=4 SV=1 [Gemmata massiliana]|uniref:Uncharacterized protein n=1 Tax=Gemmata massiliana TaxID=1210884 RepID=A0A6P2CVF2_9BACT|nr:MFS transporter [Gemmata massiliana]VTR91082.1 Putative uncharacterized protein OS=Novosphingobium sp. PP1Y GN=PP1Y_AT23285 PE=4 SV=1 [Gemmata massiliana]